LIKGGNIPRPIIPVKSVISPNPMTTIPIVLKNNGAEDDPEKEYEPKESSASIGKVPSAKKSIIESHPRNVPFERAATCMDWVKPQGKKNVPIPTSTGIRYIPPFSRKIVKKLLGINESVFLKNPERSSHTIIITREASIHNTPEKKVLILRAFPIMPRSHHKSANPIILAP
jgi:hypothetical protein